MAGHATTEREQADRMPVILAPVFVGRERELAALTEALAASPAAVLIEGEAGVGKSGWSRSFWPPRPASRFMRWWRPARRCASRARWRRWWKRYGRPPGR